MNALAIVHRAPLRLRLNVLMCAFAFAHRRALISDNVQKALTFPPSLSNARVPRRVWPENMMMRGEACDAKIDTLTHFDSVRRKRSKWANTTCFKVCRRRPCWAWRCSLPTLHATEH
eukprot:6180634-Pleurochrysis_carterae.AAC.4